MRAERGRERGREGRRGREERTRARERESGGNKYVLSLFVPSGVLLKSSLKPEQHLSVSEE